jgi:hypothetical protein
LFISTGAFSQLEPKIDALGTIFGTPAIKAEYLINENIGVELSFNFLFGKPLLDNTYENAYKQTGGGIKLEPRFYLSPDYDTDGYYLGLFYRNQSLSYYFHENAYDSDRDMYIEKEDIKNQKFSSLGLVLGYKYFFDSGIILDYGVGFGRFLSNSIESSLYEETDTELEDYDYYFSFGVGYRFDWGEEKIDADFEEF